MSQNNLAFRAITGYASRANGLAFEKMIENSLRGYEERGVAVIEKTPEPVRILKPYNRTTGQFICCFEKKAQPDFKGILQDSTMILFDAKHTSKDRISRNVVTDEQEKSFEKYMKFGAMCFIVVSLNFEKYYRVPWVVFRDMKKIYGHQFMNEEDLRPYLLKATAGEVFLLDGIKLKERRNTK